MPRKYVRRVVDSRKRGEAHYGAILTDELVLEGRRLHHAGHLLGEIMGLLAVNVDKSTMSLAVRGKTWKHLPFSGIREAPR